MIKRVNKLVCVFLVLISIFSVNLTFSTIGRANALEISAKSMVLIERDTHRILAKKDEKLRLPMASTTKIATAITVIENVENLEKEVVIPIQAVGVEGSSIYLQNGEKLKVIDLLYGLMLQSGNDCAVALALTTAGSIDGFSNMMNDLAKRVGANDTNFTNPHGLHDDNHYTTAYDLALITAHALKNPIFAKIVSTKRYEMPWQGREYNRTIVNKNKILSTYEGGDGVKTGYTKKAGRCLVSSATRNGMSVIAVVLNCGPMFEQCRDLMDYAFLTYKMVDLSLALNKITLPVENGKQSEVELYVKDNAFYPLKENEIQHLRYEIKHSENCVAPIKKDEEKGKVEFYIENQLLFTKKLYTIKGVEPLSIADRLKDVVKKWNG
jgi:D-alanyl-D-alanine carboxypeptidase (penicillin-binding protein 5/6)